MELLEFFLSQLRNSVRIAAGFKAVTVVGEQTTLKPLESKILQDFNCSEFIYCSDSGLGSAANRRFNSLGNRAYIITHSLKKMKKEITDTNEAIKRGVMKGANVKRIPDFQASQENK